MHDPTNDLIDDLTDLMHDHANYPTDDLLTPPSMNPPTS
jgi:hypothetical protein